MKDIIFEKYFEYVKNYLVENDGDNSPNPLHTFRSRVDHIRRVYIWTTRLLEKDANLNRESEEAVLTAAIFHDIGYRNDESKKSHADRGAIIFKEYAIQYGLNNELIDKVYYLIKNHSNKNLLQEKNTPMELVILLEADLLDEEGAMGVAFDCMTAGAAKVNGFEKALEYIEKYSSDILNEDPMITPYAKECWENKKKFIREFIKNFKFDLGIE